MITGFKRIIRTRSNYQKGGGGETDFDDVESVASECSANPVKEEPVVKKKAHKQKKKKKKSSKGKSASTRESSVETPVSPSSNTTQEDEEDPCWAGVS